MMEVVVSMIIIRIVIRHVTFYCDFHIVVEIR